MSKSPSSPQAGYITPPSEPVTAPLPVTPIKIANHDKSARDWDKLFAGNICIGENHSDISAKKFLIKNMERMAKEGFEILILEHFSEADHQMDIDLYLNGQDMTGALAEYIKRLNEGQKGIFGKNNEWKEYNYGEIITAAKKCGLKVICAERTIEDYIHPSKKGGRARMKSLNDLVDKISKRDSVKNSKWVAFVGTAHVNEYYNEISSQYSAPGICDIIEGVQDLIILDAENGEKSSLKTFAQKEEHALASNPKQKFKASILLTLDSSDDFDYLKITENLYKKNEQQSASAGEQEFPSPEGDLVLTSSSAMRGGEAKKQKTQI